MNLPIKHHSSRAGSTGVRSRMALKLNSSPIQKPHLTPGQDQLLKNFKRTGETASSPRVTSGRKAHVASNAFATGRKKLVPLGNRPGGNESLRRCKTLSSFSGDDRMIRTDPGHGEPNLSLADKFKIMEDSTRLAQLRKKHPKGEMPSKEQPEIEVSQFTKEQLKAFGRTLCREPSTRKKSAVAELADWSKHIDIFYGLTRSERLTLMQEVSATRMDSHEVVMEAGASECPVHVVFEGQVEIYVPGGTGVMSYIGQEQVQQNDMAASRRNSVQATVSNTTSLGRRSSIARDGRRPSVAAGLDCPEAAGKESQGRRASVVAAGERRQSVVSGLEFAGEHHQPGLETGRRQSIVETDSNLTRRASVVAGTGARRWKSVVAGAGRRKSIAKGSGRQQSVAAGTEGTRERRESVVAGCGRRASILAGADDGDHSPKMGTHSPRATDAALYFADEMVPAERRGSVVAINNFSPRAIDVASSEGFLFRTAPEDQAGGPSIETEKRANEAAGADIEVQSAFRLERRNAMLSEGRRLSVMLNGTGGALVPVQLRFTSGDVIGEERAFHNMALTMDATTGGYLHATHTVLIAKPSIILEFSERKHMETLMKAYYANLTSKIDFIRSVSSFGQCTVSSVQAMAARCVRRRVATGTILAEQGAMSDNVYFCVKGQMQIILNSGNPGEKLLNVLGAGSCFGEWGVVNNARRSAALVTATNCEVLEIAGYHFKATCDIDMLEQLASGGKKALKAQAEAKNGGSELAIGLAASLSLEEKNSKMGQAKRIIKSTLGRSKTLTELGKSASEDWMTQSDPGSTMSSTPHPPMHPRRRHNLTRAKQSNSLRHVLEEVNEDE